MLHCTPMHSTALLYSALYFTPLLHCNTVHSNALMNCNTVNFNALYILTALQQNIMHFTPLHVCDVLQYCTALHRTVLHCTALYCAALYCAALYCAALSACISEVSPDLASQYEPGQVQYWRGPLLPDGQ